MRFKNLVFLIFIQGVFALKAQDTFSILAFDSISGEVGAAGASCVDLFNIPGYSNDFICELFPGKGAVASQASYIPSNQVNARNRFNLGDSPTQLINWLVANDIQSNPQVRQYGVVRLEPVYPRSAAFTGTNCMNYKNHRLGPNYSIHGNILLGVQVLDSMEARFNREKGDLACKLMAAMQGANMVGADSRCAGNGSSSLFAFIKVSQPTDVFGQPSFILSLKTHANAGIEPIDSLQAMFNGVKSCVINTSGLNQHGLYADNYLVYPNPAAHRLFIKAGNSAFKTHCIIRDLLGEKIFETDFGSEIHLNTLGWDRGVVFVELKNEEGRSVIKKVILH
ncbi:MAG: DUF1028 domain-containing protein [Bacteroidota bacterium]